MKLTFLIVVFAQLLVLPVLSRETDIKIPKMETKQEPNPEDTKNQEGDS